MWGPSRPRAPSGVHHVLVGPSRTDRGWLGSLPRSILLIPLPVYRNTPTPRRATHAERQNPRGGPRTGARAPGGGAQRAPVARVWSHLQPAGPAPSPRSAPPISVPPLPRATHTRGDPRRTPQPPSGTRLGPSHHQVKRPNAARPPASRARLPPSMAPSNAPGIARRPSSPPRRARAP